MIAIDDVLISNDIVKEEFACNLSACKGACCWEGDFGAPVNENEQKVIVDHLPKIKKHLSTKSISLLNANGPFTQYDSQQFTGTRLHSDGSCVFLTFDELGIAKCAIEKSSEQDSTPNIKPISCHLYPIRVTTNPQVGFEAWNYDRWEICSPACSNGKKSKIKIYEFLKTAIIRAKGQPFYDQLAAAAQYLAD